jgi:rhamnose transport system permease protein
MNWFDTFLQNRALGVLGFLIVVLIGFGAAAPNFLTLSNMNTILLNGAILVIVACAGAIVVLTRNFDLSVGSTVALSAYVGFDVISRHPEWGPVGILVPVLVGGSCGVVNGLLVAYGKVPSVVATLGTMSIFRGVAYLYADGQQIDQKDLPAWVAGPVNGQIGGFAALPIIALLVVVVVALLLHRLPLGRQIYAVGSNPEAASYFGVDARRTVFAAYVLCGLLTGLAAFLFGARSSWIVPYLAQGLELTVLAAVVIGGVSVLGGSGSVIGAALGAIAIVAIDNGLVLVGTTDFVRQFVQGAAIILAVVVDALIQRRIATIQVMKRMRREHA